MSIKVRDAKWQKMAASQKPEQFVEFAQRYHVTLEPDEHYIWWQDQRINIHTREYREICQKVFLTLLKCPRVLTHLEKLEDNVIVMDEKAFPENLHCINHKVYSVWLNYIKNRYRHARKNYTFQTELMLDLLSA